MPILEVCLSGIESALAAQAGGADRIELCDNLAQGGTTPSLGMMTQVRQRLSIAMHVIIRPRGGDFCYSEAEFAVMQQDVLAAKEVGVDGVVLGILLPDGMVDKPRCRELIAWARPLSITFHRAFDMTPGPFAALDDLLELGIDRLLTSGQAETAVHGQSLIHHLQQRAGDRLAIMAGGGVTAQNAPGLLAATGIGELHAGSSCTELVPGRMTFQNPNLVMGNDAGASEYLIPQVTARRVRELVTVIRLAQS
ncbi:MAG: copper homeostasis protein CutC [Anaerolineaceae bacterium]|nr:copper homeostasis protein CutC [Anaerolineaceae bacterium]